MKMDKKSKEFSEKVEPLVRWLRENYNPRTKVIVTSKGAKLIEKQSLFYSRVVELKIEQVESSGPIIEGTTKSNVKSTGTGIQGPPPPPPKGNLQ